MMFYFIFLLQAGASLEALAKGAVQFSRRFTFRELRDRWHSLLYDPDISTQSSARMMELELSGSNPSSKFSRSDNSKSGEFTGKRKIISIRRQYNAMRKRLRNELFNSTDIGFLEPNLHDCGGRAGDFQEHVTLDNEPGDANCMLGDCISDHFGLQDSDFDILDRVFPQAVGDIAATTVVDDTGSGFHTGCQNLIEDNHSIKNVRRDSLYGFPEDIPPLIGDGGRGSFESNIDHNDAPHMLTDDSINLGKCTNSNGKHFQADDSERKSLSTFHSLNENPQSLGSGFGGRHINSPDSDGSASFHTMGFSSPMPRQPLWKTMEDISVPAMPVHMNNVDRTQGAEDTLALPDNSERREKSPSGFDVVHSVPLLRDDDNAEFADLSDSLLNFPNEDELLFMDVDGKDKMDKSCYANVNLISKSSNDVQEGGLCNVEPSKLCNIEPSTSLVSNTCLGTLSSPRAAESENIASSLHDDVHLSICHSDINMASTTVLHPDSVRLGDENICCTLNTEDPEIPCNDDIFLLIHPTTSFTPARKPCTIDSIDPASSADEKDNERGMNLMKKLKDPAPSFAWSPVIGPNMLPESFSGHSLGGCAVKSEVCDTTKCLNLHPGEANKALRDLSQSRSTHSTPVTTADRVLNEDVIKVEPRVL